MRIMASIPLGMCMWRASYIVLTSLQLCRHSSGFRSWCMLMSVGPGSAAHRQRLSQASSRVQQHTHVFLACCAGAERAGFDVLVISVDTPRMGKLDPAEYNKCEFSRLSPVLDTCVALWVI